MSIYRGAGGAGDAVADSASEALLVRELAIEVQADADAAAASAASAATSASTASTQATNSGNSASAAATSATNASNSASAASTSATNAANSATAAQTAETAAELAQTNAETAETNAETAASLAQEWATKLSTPVSGSDYSAKYNANLAASSASAASTSATNAASAQTAAESARDATLAAYDNFDDRYLGAKSSAPTLDNDGNALVGGSLYFDTVSQGMKVYTGSAWVDAYVPGSTYLAKASNLSDLNSVPQANATLMGWATTVTAAGTTTLTNTSSYQQEFTGSTTQTVVLPVTSTLALGWSFEIINNSTGSLTVNSSGGNLVGTVTAGTTASIVCRLTTGTTAASWDFDIDGFATQTGTGDVVRASSPSLSSPSMSTPQATGQLAFQGSTSSSAQFATSQTTGNTTITTSQTSGTLTIGGTNGTGTQTIGQSTVSQTTNIQAGATASGSTKTMNIGTGGLSGSTTTMALGSTFGTAVTANGQWSYSTTGSIKLPAGTTGERNGSPIAGMIRYNSSTSSFEGYTTAWGSIGGGATGAGGDTVFQENGVTITTSYTLSANKNAMSVGTITINSGAVVTIPSTQRWVIL
jgi:hypothetical protein